MKSNAQQSDWGEIEKRVAGIISNRARKYNDYGGSFMDYDDGVQESRLSLFTSWVSYDNKKGNGIHGFAYAVISNHYKTLMAKMRTQSRSAILVPIEQAGDTSGDFDGYNALCVSESNMPDASVDLESDLNNSYVESELFRFRCDLRSSLDGFAGVVLDYKTCPLLKSMVTSDDELHNIDLARYLGVTKNKMDYAIYVIRGEFYKLSVDPVYKDLFGDLSEELDWPQILVSNKKYDSDITEKAVDRWKLSLALEDVNEYSCGDCYVCYEDYSWGTVVYWGNGYTHRTVVAVGRFNKTTGDLFGRLGTRTTMPEFRQYKRALRLSKGDEK